MRQVSPGASRPAEVSLPEGVATSLSSTLSAMSTGRLVRGARQWKGIVTPLAGMVCFGLALWALHAVLHQHSYKEIIAGFDAVPLARRALALLLTVAAYAVLTGYDLLGFHAIGRSLPPGRIMLGAFVSYAFSNNFGHTLLTGAAARYWIHMPAGLSAPDVGRVVLFCSSSFWLGYLALGTALFIGTSPHVPGGLGLPWATLRPLGFAFLVPLAVYGALVVRGMPLRIGRWRLALPAPRFALGQVALGVSDLLLMAATLHVLLPNVPGLGSVQFLAFFLIALAAGAASQVPGGLGVFESSLLMLMPPEARTAGMIASLLTFRAIYYLVPMGAATVLVGILAGRKHIQRLYFLATRLGTLSAHAVPHVLAVAVFLSGTVLLFSGALPAATGRLGLLAQLVPLSFIEVSHFLASIVGMLLLLLAHGLQRRFDAAYVLTIGLLAAGMVLSLAKGGDYEEAVILGLVLAALVPCRSLFYRRASLLGAPFTWRWIASIGIVVAGSLWLQSFAFKHAEYAHAPWWQFALHAEASRSLRAIVGAVSVGILVAAARLLAPARLRTQGAGEAELERALSVIERCPWTYASLALRGDKSLLFSPSGTAFLMYARSGHSWIALGDPVGPRAEAVELAWQFRDLCDRDAGWPVFFEVRGDELDLYLELGLTLFKLGEEARVDLTAFDLVGPSRRGLRQACARVSRAGCRFEIIPRENVEAVLPQLAAVSAAWLASKPTREKGFSNASFDEAYLKRFPVAVVRNDKEILAFANVIAGAEKEELSIDLMRHIGSAPNGTMDFLFSNLMLWGRAEGFRWFNLGMAPLSGLSKRTGAPLWHFFGGLVCQYGEHFYNFRGLRGYKQKFDPEWTPRYLAIPVGAPLPVVLLDVASCVAGGVTRIVAR